MTFSKEVRRATLFFLLDESNCRLQRCEIEKKIRKQFIDINYKPKPYKAEQLDRSLKTTLERVLNHLCIKDKLTTQDSKGHMETYYSIPKNKQQAARETLVSEQKNQQYMPHLMDLIKFSTKEELQEMVIQYLTIPQWDMVDCTDITNDHPFEENLRLCQNDSSPYSNDSYFFKIGNRFYEAHAVCLQAQIPYMIRTRKLLCDFKNARTPPDVIKIGEALVSNQQVHPLDKIMFFLYPADIDQSIEWFKKYPEHIEQTKIILGILKRRHFDLIELYQRKYTDIFRAIV